LFPAHRPSQQSIVPTFKCCAKLSWTGSVQTDCKSTISYRSLNEKQLVISCLGELRQHARLFLIVALSCNVASTGLDARVRITNRSKLPSKGSTAGNMHAQQSIVRGIGRKRTGAVSAPRTLWCSGAFLAATAVVATPHWRASCSTSSSTATTTVEKVGHVIQTRQHLSQTATLLREVSLNRPCCRVHCRSGFQHPVVMLSRPARTGTTTGSS
jgi:hypothetical protein